MEKDFKLQSNEISKVLKQIEDQMVGITNEKLNIEIKSVMEEFKKVTTNETLNIVLLGDTCSGKTQLINSLLESFDDKNYNDLLVTDCNENTYYTLNIENSINGKITSKFCGEKTKIHSTTKNLKNYLEELDELGFKKIQDEKKLNTNQSTDIESIFMENDSSVQTKVLNIQLPNLDKNLRIVDTPGLTAHSFISRFSSILKNSKHIVFLYVFGCDQDCDITVKTGITLKVICELFPDSPLYFIINKIDLIFDNIKSDDFDCNEQLKSLSSKFGMIEQNLRNFIIPNVFPLDDKSNKINANQIIHHIKLFYNLNIDILNHNNSLSSLRNKLIKVNNNNENKKLFDDNIVKLVKEQIIKSRESLLKKIELHENKINSLSGFKDFMSKYSYIFSHIDKAFNQNNLNILKDTYFNQKTFVSDQVNLLYELFNDKINNDLYCIMDSEVNNINSVLEKHEINLSLKAELKVTLKKRTFDLKNFIDKNSIESWHCICRNIFSACIYTAVWDRGSRLEEIIKTLLSEYKANLNQITTLIVKEFDKTTNDFIDKVASQKHLNSFTTNALKIIEENRKTLNLSTKKTDFCSLLKSELSKKESYYGESAIALSDFFDKMNLSSSLHIESVENKLLI